jgi:hypothetical protein
MHEDMSDPHGSMARKSGESGPFSCLTARSGQGSGGVYSLDKALFVCRGSQVLAQLVEVAVETNSIRNCDEH